MFYGFGWFKRYIQKGGKFQIGTRPNFVYKAVHYDLGDFTIYAMVYSQYSKRDLIRIELIGDFTVLAADRFKFINKSGGITMESKAYSRSSIKLLDKNENRVSKYDV